MEQQQVTLSVVATAQAGPSIYVDLQRGAHKILTQELPMNIPEELSYKHQCRASSTP